MAVPTPVARSRPDTAPSKGNASPAMVPFTLASLRRCEAAFDTGNVSLGQQISSIEIPATGGFARYIELEVTGTTSGNLANVAFQADGPFSALSFIQFTPPSGDPPIVPHTGYQLFLWNKYGAFGAPPGLSADPRCDQATYSVTTGTGATGGSFRFRLRLPFEIDPNSGFGSLTNSAANKSYLLTLHIASSSAIYTTAPTNAPTVQVTGRLYFWDEPAGATRQGTQQQSTPIGLGSFSQLRLEQPPITAGDKLIKLNNTGPVLRAVGWVLRNSSSARIANTATTDIPQLWQWVFNTHTRFLLSDRELLSDMGRAYGYGRNTGGAALAVETGLGLDNGVRFLPYFQEDGGVVTAVGPRSQYQVTADATLTQIRGTSFGTNVATMELLTNVIRPASSAALYPSNRIV